MSQKAFILTNPERTMALAAKCRGEPASWIPIASPMPCRTIEVYAVPWLAEADAEAHAGSAPLSITPVVIDEDGDMAWNPEPGHFGEVLEEWYEAIEGFFED